MRPDMHKVIVERPRRGSRGPFRSAVGRRNVALEDLPSKEGLQKRYLGRDLRALNEHLAPLKRFLRKQVGRPWNKIYCEIAARLRPASAVQQHVRDHIWDYVERHVTIGPDGVVYHRPRFGPPEPWPLRQGDLYVHPKTGILLAAKKRRGQAARTPGHSAR
jgi:hypothetical protein